MEAITFILPFLFVLTIVVFFHELGHFGVARFFGVRVETFSIGFGRQIFGWTDSRGTVWKIGWLPLGGYVKFFGDESAASTPDQAKLNSTMTLTEREECFHFKPLYQRAAVVAAGPIANFILAIAIFTVMILLFGREITEARIGHIEPGSVSEAAGLQPDDLVLSVDGDNIISFGELKEKIMIGAGQPMLLEVDRGGKIFDVEVTPVAQTVEDRFGKREEGSIGIAPYSRPLVAGVVDDTAASEAGLQAGDKIISIDGNEIESFVELLSIIKVSAEKEMPIVVLREGREVSLTITPRLKESDDPTDRQGIIGVRLAQDPDQTQHIRYDPLSAMAFGTERTWGIVEMTLSYIGGIIRGVKDASQISGPIGIANTSHEVSKIGFSQLIHLTAVLSISIGLINLFPIPMLDGGHLLYYGYEAVRGKPLGERTQEYGFRIGLTLVIMLMVFATWNDLVKFKFF